MLSDVERRPRQDAHRSWSRRPPKVVFRGGGSWTVASVLRPRTGTARDVDGSATAAVLRDSIGRETSARTDEEDKKTVEVQSARRNLDYDFAITSVTPITISVNFVDFNLTISLSSL
jgi:hypothetical protein